MSDWKQALSVVLAWSTDIGAVAGGIMIAVGAGKIYEPAGLIVGGIELLALGLLSAARRNG